MSGIVGIINLDGAPVDRALLQDLTDSLAYRGPDAQDIWVAGPVGFGHTLLRTTPEQRDERQPLSVDGHVWITADLRIDARAELLAKLASHGRPGLDARPDAELVLHSYQVWGDGCLEHLIGDFSFAIWDERQKRLFCARDHFGVKPFYYALSGDTLIFSNTLNCVRRHQVVSDKLNDLAIADFLLFDLNYDPATTAFADVQRLPPAHSLTWSAGSPRLGRYWTLPVNGHIRYKRQREYVEEFRSLFGMAVGDRLRTHRVAVLMSGGLDSTAVAASAHERLSKAGSFDMRAFTVVYDELVPDQERHYSGLVANALGIPIRYVVADHTVVYGRLDHPVLRTPEPRHQPMGALWIRQLEGIRAHSRVALTGYGGDPIFSSSRSYVEGLVRERRFARLACNAWQLALLQHRLPRIGLRGMVKHRLGKGTSESLPYPAWLNKSLSSRLGLPERFARFTDKSANIRAPRPEVHRELSHPYYPSFFEGYDPGITLSPVEFRHPLFDLRVVNYLLAIPPLPWFNNKDLLRAALRDVLPEPVRLRPKAIMTADPIGALIKRSCVRGIDPFEPMPELAQYVDPAAVHPGGSGPDVLWTNLRPFSLNNWLQHRGRPDLDLR